MKGSTPAPRSGERIAFYGTLMRGLGGLDELGIEGELRYLEPCSCAGALHDLGAYPGLVASPSEPRSTDRVQGELFEILDVRIMATLDAFEGFDPNSPDDSLYTREDAELPEPAGERAWLYLYNQPLPTPDPAATRIDGGDWRSHVAQTRGSGNSPPNTT